MAGIITNIGEDIKSLQQLRQEIENVKKALGSIDINVKIDIRKELEQKLQALTKQYDTLVSKAAEADAKLMESAARIDKAVDTITKAQEKASKSTVDNADTSTTKAQVAAVEGQAKAYIDLKDEIDSILGTREQNIRQMVQEQNAIKLINAEIAQINKSRQYGGGLTATQSQRLQQLNDSLLTHKQALAEVRQELNNNAKLDIAAVGSMNELSQSLSRMRIAYRALNEDERNSQFGQNLLKSIQEADARIKELDATIGNHQRNVGNYQSFNGLNMSVQQIVRELPSATMGVNMFFMAISNNLPIMADQIKLAKEANKAMKAAGGEPVPVWKQLVSSLFSWQTAMMVGITLLTVYGKDIANWVKGLFNAKTAISDLLFTQQQLSAAQKEARKDAISEQVKLKTLYATTRDTTLAMKDRLTAVEKLKKQYPSYFSQLSNEAILAGKAAGAYRQLAADILKAAQARAMEKRIEKLADRNFDLERYNTADKNWQSRNSKAYKASVGSHSATDTGGARAFVPTGVDMSGGKRDGELEQEWNQRQERLQNHTAEFNRNVKAIELLTSRVAKIKATEINLDNPTTPKPEKNTVNTTPPKPVDYAKITREQSDAERDLAYQVAQSRIDAEEDAAKREQMQRVLNHKKELDDIEKQKNDLIQKHIANAKEIFEADPKNEGKKFDGSKITLTAAEQKQYNEIRANIIQKQQREDREAEEERIKNQRATWQTYYKEFGTYAEKRKALQEELNDKLAEIDKKDITASQKKAEKATITKQYANQLDELDNSVKNSTMLMGQLFADASKKSISEIDSIIDKTQLLLKYLESVKDENGDATINGEKVSRKDIIGMGVSENSLFNIENDPTRIESIRSALDRMRGELGDKSPFVLLKKQIRDAVDEMDKGGKKNIATGIFGIVSAVKEFLPEIKEFGDSLGTIFGSEGIGDKISRVTDAFDGLTNVGGGIAQVMSGDIVGGAMSAVNGISKVVTAFDNMFGADYSHYNDMVEKYNILNSIWDELIDKKLEYIETSYGPEAQKIGDEAVTFAKQSQESDRILGRERLNSGASAGSHSIGVRQRKNISSEGWQELMNASSLAGFDYSKVAEGRMTGLFDLTAEQLQKVKENAQTFWAQLDDDVREYLDGIIDGEERINDILDKQKEQFTQISFDSLYDGFVDKLMDMDSAWGDFSDGMSETFMRAVLSNQVGAMFRDKLQSWHDQFSTYMTDGNLTEAERKELSDTYQEYAKQAIEMRNNIAAAVGYSGTDSQNATANGISNISYDQADNLTGIMTSIQIAGEQRNAKLDTVGAQMTLMNTRVDDIRVSQMQTRDIANDTRDILANSYVELKEINLNTGNSEKHLKEMKSDISDMKRIINDKL
jgi:hypothetical protein